MKIYAVNPLDKGYKVEAWDSESKARKTSGHSSRKNAVDGALFHIPKEKGFLIIVLDDNKDNTRAEAIINSILEEG